MALKMKTFNTILNNMASWITSNSPSLTNFRVGSVIRTLLEAVAIEVESLYLQMHRGFNFSIENSIYHSFDFQKLPATASSGDITIEMTRELKENVLIPEGYLFCTQLIDGAILNFTTVTETLLPAGITKATVRVQCTQTGIGSNVPAYSITRAVVQLPIFKAIYNELPFTNGTDEELTEDRKARFTQYISTLAKGTKEALKYGCLKVPGVTGVSVEERIGEVNIYVHDGSGELPQELKTAVTNSVLDYKAAGIQVNVLAITRKHVDLTIGVKLAPGFSDSNYSNMISSSVTTFLNSFTVSKDLTMAELIRHVMNIDTNAILNVTLNISQDIDVQSYELVRAGTITVNILS